MTVRITPQARRDLQTIRDYYHREDPEAAERVASALLTAIALVGRRPDIGIRSIRSPELRSKLVMRLPYRIHYRFRDGAVDILRVRHTARRAWP